MLSRPPCCGRCRFPQTGLRSSRSESSPDRRCGRGRRSSDLSRQGGQREWWRGTGRSDRLTTSRVGPPSFSGPPCDLSPPARSDRQLDVPRGNVRQVPSQISRFGVRIPDGAQGPNPPPLHPRRRIGQRDGLRQAGRIAYGRAGTRTRMSNDPGCAADVSNVTAQLQRPLVQLHCHQVPRLGPCSM